jgi:lipoyl(octanoyl) transferase
MTRQIEFLDWGLTEYADAWKRQEELFQLLLQNKKNTDFNTHYVVFCQHFPVYTLGKNGHEENLLLNRLQLQTRGASFFRTNRGGDITFHGPGQVVGYFIFDLEKLQLGLKVFIFKLEEVITHLLEHYGLKGTRLPGATGVWLDAETPRARKICAIGLRSSHFVTMHGFALNVNTDLNYFNYIHPCGFVDKGVTSLQKELSQIVNEDDVKKQLKHEIEREFL